MRPSTAEASESLGGSDAQLRFPINALFEIIQIEEYTRQSHMRSGNARRIFRALTIKIDGLLTRVAVSRSFARRLGLLESELGFVGCAPPAALWVSPRAAAVIGNVASLNPFARTRNVCAPAETFPDQESSRIIGIANDEFRPARQTAFGSVTTVKVRPEAEAVRVFSPLGRNTKTAEKKQQRGRENPSTHC
jgi:hypothetical protein